MNNGAFRKPYFLLPALSLWWRDLTGFYRQPSRVVGALGPPIVFWLLLGLGIGDSFRPPGADSPVHFLQFFFPGILALTILFTSIFTNIALIQDKTGGFLQGVLVAPVAPAAIVMGRVLGGTTIATFQGMLLVIAAPLAGYPLTIGSFLSLFGISFLTCFGLTAMSFAMAWKMDSIQGFHSIMNFVLAPMWFLSGAFFPAEGAPFWLKGLMLVNPLTYGVDALRQGLYLGQGIPAPVGMSLGVTLAVMAVFSGACYVWSVKVASKTPEGSL